jgi:hypothetical protein
MQSTSETYTYRLLDEGFDFKREEHRNGATSTIVSKMHRSHAFFCSTCGKLWASIECSDADKVWEVAAVPCPRHKPQGVADWGSVPGSFLLRSGKQQDMSPMHWARAIENLPAAVLDWELWRHLDMYDEKMKGANHGQSSISPTYKELNEVNFQSEAEAGTDIPCGTDTGDTLGREHSDVPQGNTWRLRLQRSLFPANQEDDSGVPSVLAHE